jgi:regulator of sirC expression with transglutaminase-like and TPR domain
MVPMRKPLHCRRRAHELFRAQVGNLDAPGALLRAAVAISMHELADADPGSVEARIEEYAARVRERVKTGESRAYLAHLHAVLFDEEGFCGEEGSYDEPQNSYLPVVVERRRGLPIALTLVYKEVGERVGLAVEGVNAPGHFLAAVESEGRRMLVDPFGAGRVLTRDEAFARIARVSGRTLPQDDDLLRPASPRQWLARMIQNLLHTFSQRDRDRDVAAMIELRDLL